MIKYNNNTINDWNFGDDNIIKVYKHGAVCYYKLDSSSPSGQTPCFAVVDDITQYQETEFEDVFNNADSKWYKLNNINQYEEYGVYGSGRSVTTYEGKLTIDGDYEYIYSGGSWVNVGEVSGSSYVDYIETPTSSPYAGIELLTSPSSTSTPMYYDVDFMLTNTYREQIIIGQPSNAETVGYQFKFCAYVSPYFDFGGGRINVNWDSIGGQGNRCHVGIGVYSGDSKVELRNLSTDTRINYSNSIPTNVIIPVLCAASYNTNTSGDTYVAQKTSSALRYYGIKIYDNNVLVGDYVPAKNPSTNEYTFYETISQRYCSKIGNGTIIGHESSQYEYPLEYPVIQDPPNNITFTSMTEAEEYECPWVGMNATIDGDKYIFSGDSQSGYEWVYNPSRLPVGYTEVEYIQNYASTSDSTNTLAYINTNFTPTQNTRTIGDIKIDKATKNPRIFGSGNWNILGYIVSCEETIGQSNSYIYYKYGQTPSWYTTSIHTDLNRHVYDLNNNGNFVIDNNVIDSLPSTTFTCGVPMGIFTSQRTGSSVVALGETIYGKLYSFKVYESGTLVRDFVPCINPSNVVGVYDIVNDVFYGSANGNSLIAGNPI